MNRRTYHNWKRSVEVTKDYQEFTHRLRMKTWTQPETDAQLRLKALIQFHPNHTNRQIINRASIGGT